MNNEVHYFSVYDLVANMHGPMFPAVNDGVAKRMFRNILKETDNPKEYGLWHIGIFDQATGEFKPDSKYVCSGSDLLEVKE